jgi:bifunctional non-homologous end joining protein LigD
MLHRPMPLVRIPEPFDHPDWVFELKHDGFRALANIRGHRCQLVSRRGHVYKTFTLLAEEMAHAVRANDAILDGEIVCLAPDGRALFHDLLFRRDWSYFIAFDLLQVDGQDVRSESLVTRKRRLLSTCRVSSRAWCTCHTLSAAASICSRRSVNAISRGSSPSGSAGRISATAS